MASNPQLGQANLVALPSHLLNEEGLTSHIASRFHARHPISTISSQAIVSINTFTSPSQGSNGNKNGSATGAMEELAQRLYSRLSYRLENQAVTFLGESGGGKSSIQSLLMRYYDPVDGRISFDDKGEYYCPFPCPIFNVFPFPQISGNSQPPRGET